MEELGKLRNRSKGIVCDFEVVYFDVLVYYDFLLVFFVVVFDSVLVWTFGCSYYYFLVRVD